MRILGKSWTKKNDGSITTTLHLASSFPDYYRDSEAGRSCEGEAVETVYVGKLDCSKLPIGAEVELTYDKAILTKNGSIYQPIKEVRLIK